MRKRSLVRVQDRPLAGSQAALDLDEICTPGAWIRTFPRRRRMHAVGDRDHDLSEGSPYVTYVSGDAVPAIARRRS
jgi:hypothetical protein